MAAELALKDARISEGDAWARAGRAEGELAAARDEAARTRAAAAERDRLSQKLMDFEDQTESGGRRIAGQVAGLESCLEKARKAERAALMRAERAEAEAGALRGQLTQLTATLRDKGAGTSTGGRRGAA